MWREATAPVDELRRAEAIASEAATARAPSVTTGPCTSVTGSGTPPGVEIPLLWGRHGADDYATALRRARPIITTARRGATQIDLRTVEPADASMLVTGLVTLDQPEDDHAR